MLAGQADQPLHEGAARTAADPRGRRRHEDDDLASLRLAKVVDQPVREHAVGEARLAAVRGLRAVERGLHRRRRDPVRIDDPRLDREHDRDRTDDRDHPVDRDAPPVREAAREPVDGVAREVRMLLPPVVLRGRRRRFGLRLARAPEVPGAPAARAIQSRVVEREDGVEVVAEQASHLGREQADRGARLLLDHEREGEVLADEDADRGSSDGGHLDSWRLPPRDRNRCGAARKPDPPGEGSDLVLRRLHDERPHRCAWSAARRATTKAASALPPSSAELGAEAGAGAREAAGSTAGAAAS